LSDYRYAPSLISLITTILLSFLEYANKGSLQSFIASHNLYTEFGLNLILRWAKDIALGMNYLHEETVMKIIHRDLKSTNGKILKEKLKLFSNYFLFSCNYIRRIRYDM
jgi:serine/threonine protein kinase